MWNIKFVLKSLKKSFSITFINIIGFSLGLCVTFFLIQYLLNEYSYDSFQKDKDRIFRVAVKSYQKDKFEDETYVYTSEMGTALKQDFPGVEQYATISYPKSDIFYYNNSPFKIEHYRYASSGFFQLFSFNLKEGDPQKALENPYSLVVTEKLAESLFGNHDPVGKQLILNDQNYTITGVAADPPKNTDVRFNMLISFSTRYKQKNVYMGWNGGNQYIHYIKLVSGTDITTLSAKADTFMWKYINKDYEKVNIKDEIYFQPLPDIHLHHNADSGWLRTSILTFSMIALMLLVVVIINFINLFIANAGKQLKTMGLVKIHGASRSRTIKYLLTEIAVLISVSILIALALVSLFHPWFEQLAGKPIPTIAESGFAYALLIVCTILIVTLLSAFFPSLFISSVQPSKIIKNNVAVGKSGKTLKNGLVVFQFFISILLIVATLTLQKQIRFMQGFNSGYDKENVLILPLQTSELRKKADLLKQEIAKISGVKNSCAVSEVPYDGLTSNGYFPEGKATPELINVIDVDEDFLSMLNISVTKGENFSQEMGTDDNAYLVNEALVKKMGWDDPIGKTIRRGGVHPIIGVVKDFNFASLRSSILPLIITNKSWDGYFNYLLVKTSGTNISETIKEIAEKWENVVPNSLFEYSFLDQQFDQAYRIELSIQRLVQFFSVVTILIALLGLLGLSKFSIDNRVKEIGVRKVNGATISEILMLLNKNYVALIVTAFGLAVPLSWFVMNKLLENFAYKTGLSWWIFALAGILALGIALLTVSWQSWRAATRNPVEALRYE
ncbi:FtsX-like permease family protein [Maribellus comscasis]|uniref:FtsX-like permease family protein n=1 Tax=Maribellus comscasis TaxID=2681766 RepID=A0A6I6JVX7_9BACT|nr:ABC transporter permease [Maribellus comscasis]QGY47276.1 FtsX-like permease family protein [Maribellus comscasis]